MKVTSDFVYQSAKVIIIKTNKKCVGREGHLIKVHIGKFEIAL